MKKIFALLISAFLLIALTVAPVSAEEGTLFWLTHYNDGTVEGAGTIFTESDTAGTWWHHVAFAPVEGEEDVFEIVELCIGDGNAYSLAIPEGGFVYAINTGNDWPSLFQQNGATGDGSTGLWFDDAEHAAMPNYTSPNCTGSFNLIYNWSVGLTFKFTGLDLEGQTIPTTTPDLGWYEEDYVCTATFATYTGETEEPATSEGESESDETSAPADETSADATVSEDAASEDAASEDATVSEDAASEDAAVSEEVSEPADEAEGGLSTGALIAIIAAGVVVIGVIVLVVVKSKK